jgi:hypothetical protein
MKRHEIKQLLLDLNPQTVAEHSCFDHHVVGMDYLCLHRSDKLTVKLYFIDPKHINAPAGDDLVIPHTHRYAFESTVLAGKLGHMQFEECGATDHNAEEVERFTYVPEAKTRIGGLQAHIRLIQSVDHRSHLNPSYWCDTKTIHTLAVPREQVLLGLVQFADTVPTSHVYLEKGGEMRFTEPRTMKPIDAWNMRNKALEMMEQG